MEYGYPNALSVELDSTNHFSVTMLCSIWRNLTEASCLQWLRRDIEWKSKLFTATAMISWGSTLLQRLYSLTISENIPFGVKCVSFFFSYGSQMHLKLYVVSFGFYLSQISMYLNVLHSLQAEIWLQFFVFLLMKYSWSLTRHLVFLAC